MRVGVVSERLARQLWPGRSPLGARLPVATPDGSTPGWTVVGVAGNVKYAGADREGDHAVYVPYTQSAAGVLHFVVRTRGEPLGQASAVSRAV